MAFEKPKVHDHHNESQTSARKAKHKDIAEYNVNEITATGFSKFTFNIDSLYYSLVFLGFSINVPSPKVCSVLSLTHVITTSLLFKYRIISLIVFLAPIFRNLSCLQAMGGPNPKSLIEGATSSLP
jgi:hypothetical protein